MLLSIDLSRETSTLSILNSMVLQFCFHGHIGLAYVHRYIIAARYKLKCLRNFSGELIAFVVSECNESYVLAHIGWLELNNINGSMGN